MSCGKFIKGYREYHCKNPTCTHVKYVTQSCNSRFCPTCGKRATDQWIIKQQETLPKCDWQHITFTIPKQLWYFLKQQPDLLNEYAKQAANSIQKMAKKKGIQVGIFIAIHTFGRDLQWHPHIHLSVTMGGLCEKSQQWRNLRFSKKAIMPIWKYNIITMIRKAMKSGKISCSNKLLNEQYNKYWIVHFAKPTESPFRTISYLGRYLKRPPISMSRLFHYDGKSVAFNYLNHRIKKHQNISIEMDHFIYLFTQHIPKKGFRLIRYYGFLANRIKNKILPKIYKLLEQTVNLKKFMTWKASHLKEFGEDPLKCILCSSRMVFIRAHHGMPHREIVKHHKALALRQIINL